MLRAEIDAWARGGKTQVCAPKRNPSTGLVFRLFDIQRRLLSRHHVPHQEIDAACFHGNKTGFKM